MKTETNPSLGSVSAVMDDMGDRRALVIDDDPVNRREICNVLAGQGYEVSACDSVAEGKRFFRGQPLVVAGAGNGEISEFVAHVREAAGELQPYVITVEPEGGGQGIPGEGVNDVLRAPFDAESVSMKIKVAQHWLAGRPAKVTGNWEDTTDGGEEQPLFDPSTAELAKQLLEDEPAAPAAETAPADPEPVEAVEEQEDKIAAPAAPAVRAGSGRAASKDVHSAPSRAQLEMMVEACPLVMAMFDRDMRYVFANAPWRRAFALAESNLVGRCHFEIFSDVPEAWQEMCTMCLTNGAEQGGEELVEWADGSRDWVRWTMRPWFSEDGAVSGLVVTAESITNEKKLEREQRFERDLSQAVMSSSGNPVLVLDPNGRIVRSNALANRLGSWDPAGEGDRYYWEAFLRKGNRRESQEQFLEFAKNLLERGEFTFPEVSIEDVVGHDGKARRVVWTNSPRRDEDGEITGLIRVGFDLEQFRDPGSDTLLRDSVLEQLPVPGWRCNREGKVDLFNTAWLTFRGRELEEEIDNGWMDGLSEDDVDPISDALLAAVTENQAFSKVVRLTGGDGQTHWVRLSADPAKSASDNHIYGVAIDVTVEHEFDAARGEAARLKESAEAGEARAARFEADLAAATVELSRLKSAGDSAGKELERFRTIPESAPFGIVLLGRDGKTLYANPAQAEVAGSDIGAADSLESWLAAHCPEGADFAAAELVDDWRAKVWRKGATSVFSLRTDGGQLRELEFRPRLMDDGGLLLTIFDVTDMRRGEEALRASEAKFRNLFQDSAVGMALVAPDGRVFDSNPALEALLGFTHAELRERAIADVLGAGSNEERDAMLDSIDAGEPASGELVVELATADGEEIAVQMHVSQVRGADGGLQFTTFFIHDVSARLQAERGLEDSQAENRALFGASPDMIVVLDASGRVVELIPPVDFSLKVDREAALGRELGDVFRDLNGRTAELLEAVSREGAATRHLRAEQEGETFDYEIRAARSGAGNTVLLVRDVTQVRKAQTKLKWQALTFAHISDAIVVADMRGRVIDWNPAAEELFGYSKEAAVGMPLYEIYGTDDPAAYRDEFTSAIRNDGRWASRSAFDGAGGVRGECDAVFVPLQDEDGAPVALVGINQSVEKEPETSEQAADAGAGAAEARAEMQQRLNVTLKTISTLLGLQARTEDGQSARASKARVDALALLQSHIGQSEDHASVDFGAFARELIGELLETEAPEETDVSVHLHAKEVALPAALAMPLALIANELLTNAFRFGCKGREEAVVGLGVDLDGESGSGTLVVKDDGRALPEGFSIEEAAGLGLRIVRGLAERIGGAVEVGDEPATEFRVGFRLPPSG